VRKNVDAICLILHQKPSCMLLHMLRNDVFYFVPTHCTHCCKFDLYLFEGVCKMTHPGL
jgi:hypothetical protein